MKDARETVQKLLTEMEPILLLVGCNPNQVRVAEGEFKLKSYNVAYDWLHKLYLGPEYSVAEEIYKSVPEHAWKNYAAMGTEGLWEQEAIKEQGAPLLKAWRTKRPRLFGRDQKPKADDDVS